MVEIRTKKLWWGWCVTGIVRWYGRNCLGLGGSLALDIEYRQCTAEVLLGPVTLSLLVWDRQAREATVEDAG